MTKKEVTSATPKVAAEFNKLFGPPPLLQPEDKAIYDAIVGGLAQDEKPRCFIARILIRDRPGLPKTMVETHRDSPYLGSAAPKNTGAC
jgi:hypothetical protein